MKIQLLCVAGLIAAAPTFAMPTSTVPTSTVRATSAPMTSFARFDRRAKAGEHLNIVFFGASLTWGANASDPNLTSYRSAMARRFEATYPRAHFRFFDAAIGGTGSQLGVFRLERDVLRHKPDLVFLDFSANDDIYGQDEESLASYESLVRRIILEAKCPLIQVIFPFQWNIKAGELDKMKRLTAHYAIAKHYDTSVGDAVQLAMRRVESGQVKIETLWPLDGVHPGDKGYALFADAAFAAFQAAVREKKVCHAPAQMLHASTYMNPTRARLSQLGELPAGWKAGRPNRVSAWYDSLMSRWLDDEVVATGKGELAPLRLKFRGSIALLFGEGTPTSGKYRMILDGKPVERKNGDTVQTEFDAGATARSAGGNVRYVELVGQNLDPNIEHTLEIVPLFAADVEQELRLESLCVAGASQNTGPVHPIVSQEGVPQG